MLVKNCPGNSKAISYCSVWVLGAFLRQASEQYLTDSQFLAHDFLQVISFLQTTQVLLGRKLLFPLKASPINAPRVRLSERGSDLHGPQCALDLHR